MLVEVGPAQTLSASLVSTLEYGPEDLWRHSDHANSRHLQPRLTRGLGRGRQGGKLFAVWVCSTKPDEI